MPTKHIVDLKILLTQNRFPEFNALHEQSKYFNFNGTTYAWRKDLLPSCLQGRKGTLYCSDLDTATDKYIWWLAMQNERYTAVR